LPTESRHTAIALHAVGQELRRQGKHDQALEHYNRALALQRMILGAKHPYTASTLTAIGQMLHILGNHSAALDHHRQALAIKREFLGPGHVFTANTLFDLGRTLQALDQKTDALASFARALTVQHKVLGPHHARTAATQQAIAEILQSAGPLRRGPQLRPRRPRGARAPRRPGQRPHRPGPRHRSARSSTSRASTPRPSPTCAAPSSCSSSTAARSHDDTLSALQLDLGRVLHRLGDAPAALSAFRRNLDGLRASLGSEHPRVAGTLNAIGQVHYGQGNYKAALEHYHQALEIRQRTLGPDHWQTATSRFNCGTAMRELGDPWGQTEMQSAADTLERLLGPNTPTSRHPLLAQADRPVRKDMSPRPAGPPTRAGPGAPPPHTAASAPRVPPEFDRPARTGPAYTAFASKIDRGIPGLSMRSPPEPS
jgi:tetratricopeptide (TPR) repeat protein